MDKSNLDMVIEDHFETFVNMVAEAVEVLFNEKPKQESLWLGEYNKGVGTRISIEDKFSVDLRYDNLEISDNPEDYE